MNDGAMPTKEDVDDYVQLAEEKSMLPFQDTNMEEDDFCNKYGWPGNSTKVWTEDNEVEKNFKRKKGTRGNKKDKYRNEKTRRRDNFDPEATSHMYGDESREGVNPIHKRRRQIRDTVAAIERLRDCE